jgi:hypothetical protein
MTAEDDDKGRNEPGEPALRDLVPHTLSIRPNYDLNAIEFEVVDQEQRGFVVTINCQDLPDLLLKSIRAWARLRDHTNTP